MENINNYEERLSLLDPEQRAHWELTGSLEDSEAKTPPVEETTSRSDDDQNDPHVYQSGTTAAEPVEATDGEWLQDAIQKHPDLVVSTVALDQMLNTRQNGGALVDYLSSHKDEAEELVRETGLGIETWEDYLHVVEAAQTNPELLAQLVRAHTLAEIRLDQIEKKLGKDSSQMARAIRSGDFNTYSRLANKRDVDRAERGYPQASGSIREAIQSGNFELYEKLANKKDAERRKYGR